MTTTDRAATQRIPMDPLRKRAYVAGALYLITFVSIPTLALYRDVRAPGFVLGAGPDGPVFLGGVLEMIVGLAGIGTAVVLYPVVKRQNASLALGFVGSRVLEAAGISASVATILSLVTLRQSGAGADAAVTGQMLVALHDWTFTLSQTLMPAVNAFLLGTLLYRSRLVPRALPLLGLVGAPILLVSTVATLLGINEYGSAWSGLGALPIATWEFSLGVYLVVRGFRPAAVAALAAARPGLPDVVPAELAPATR